MKKMYESEEDVPNPKDDGISWITSDLYHNKNKKQHCFESKPLHQYEKKMQIYEQEKRRQSEPIISKISNLAISTPQLKDHEKSGFDLERSTESEKMPYSYAGLMKQSPLFPSSAENSPMLRRRLKNTFEKCFLVKLYIERRDTHLGPFPFEILPKMNVRLLKLKVEKEFGIPTSSQKWILNNSLAVDNDLSLSNYDIVPGSPIILYVDSRCEKPIHVNQSYPCSSPSSPKSKNELMYNNIDSCGTKVLDHSTIRNVTSVNNQDNLNKEFLKRGSKSILNHSKINEEVRQKKVSDSVLQQIKGTHLSSPDCDKTKIEGKFSNKINKEAKLHKRKYTNTKGPFEPVFAKIKEKDTHILKDGVLSKADESNINAEASINSHIPSTNPVLTEMSKPLIPTEKHLVLVGDNNSTVNHSNSERNKILELKKHDQLDMDNVPVASCSSVEKISNLKLKPNLGSILQKVKLKHKSKSLDENYYTTVSNENVKKKVEEETIKYIILTTNATKGSEIDTLSHTGTEECSSKPVDSSQEIKVMKPDVHENYLQVSNENTSNDIVSGSHFNEMQERISEKPNILENFNHDMQSLDVNISGECKVTEISIKNIADKHSSENQTDCSRSAENVDEIPSCDHNEQNLQKENEQLNKKTVENYEYFLKIEDLNLVKNVTSFTCPICFGDFESDQGVVLHECLHTFCLDCLARTVDFAEEVLIKCPYRDDEYSCQSYLQQREIKALVSSEIYERYLQRSIITAESIAEKSFHCKTPDCPGWCMFDDNINVFPCPVCLHYNCLNCRTIHEGLNCRQYQDKLKSEKKLDPDSEKTLQFLDKMIESGKALRCPKCDLILMKKWGCDWLKCAVCLTEICWITKGPRWGPAGQGDTSGGCRCGVNGVKCHPSCTYCH
ncbi:ranBP-type and C3HC4-type zinc finger-containing protein 1 [Trichonephila clavata]|uniref:RanBP-type and C3HC4-type zinc finger-containing protein 1 n=1 Tax=Trichonephila clavata TaxID=2740835 RepID=A0A8X6I0C6_TRICU|nr:ranBP-type and C3HC4-type zinc finger-containing protein 1 [Trichonephila clavata]